MSATVMAGLQVAANVVMLTSSRFSMDLLSAVFLNLMAGLILPACGFLGATRSNTGMMCCFCGTNLVAALFQGMVLLLVAVALVGSGGTASAEIQAACDSTCRVVGCGFSSATCTCKPGCSSEALEGVVGCCADFADACTSQQFVPQLSCAELKSTIGAVAQIISIVFIILVTPGFLLSAYAGYHGMELWRRLAAGEFLVSQGAMSLVRSPQRAGDEEDVAHGGDAAE